jgi:hypothetical protein
MFKYRCYNKPLLFYKKKTIHIKPKRLDKLIQEIYNLNSDSVDFKVKLKKY